VYGGGVNFAVSATSYDRFMGRYSAQLSPQLADLAGVEAGQRVLDGGAGSGMLTAELVERLGPDAVSAVDPSESFVAAVRERHPGVDVHLCGAEEMPFADATFDAALAQLVISFMNDPVAGLREMARVTRPGGVIAACMWDLGGGRAPISPFWRAALELDPDAQAERRSVGVREGEIVALFEKIGLTEISQTAHSSTIEHPTLDDWWQPFGLGVGPAGAYVHSLDAAHRDALRERCRELLGDGPFMLQTWAWAARGVVTPG
jgi:SAM-dependent methyltransferase